MFAVVGARTTFDSATAFAAAGSANSDARKPLRFIISPKPCSIPSVLRYRYSPRRLADVTLFYRLLGELGLGVEYFLIGEAGILARMAIDVAAPCAPA